MKICKARFKSVILDCLVTVLLCAMASTAAVILSSDDMVLIEVILSASLSAAFLIALVKINRIPVEESPSSKYRLESDKQIIERCRRELHAIVMVISGVLILCMILGFALTVNIIYGAIDWVEYMT